MGIEEYEKNLLAHLVATVIWSPEPTETAAMAFILSISSEVTKCSLSKIVGHKRRNVRVHGN